MGAAALALALVSCALAELDGQSSIPAAGSLLASSVGSADPGGLRRNVLGNKMVELQTLVDALEKNSAVLDEEIAIASKNKAVLEDQLSEVTSKLGHQHTDRDALSEKVKHFQTEIA